MDLTDAYENGAYVPGMAEIAASWPLDAAAFREGAKVERNLVYGSSERERFDLFLPEGTPKGLMVFVHGGYWRITSKDHWSHLARGAVAQGWAVAVPGYTLCPQIQIAGITRQIATAVTAAAARIAGPLVITGHSAGGHLSARMAMPGVLPEAVAARLQKVVPISPLSDLRPLMQTAMNSDLQLDLAEAEAESPVLGTRLDVPVHVWVGGGERPAFLDQARWLREAWDCALTITEGEHHFDVVRPLEQAGPALMATLLE